MYVTGFVVGLLGATVGLLVSAVDINAPFLVIILLSFLIAGLGFKYVIHWLCTLTLPTRVSRAILSKTFLSRFDPVQATLSYVPREDRPQRQLSVCLRQETEQLIDLIVRDFVMSWYEWVSNDQFVPDEVASALHNIVSHAHRIFQQVDQHKVFCDIVLLGRVHITCYQYTLENVDRKENAPDYHEAVARLYCKRFAELVKNHPDVDNEPKFLRQIVDLLLGLLMPVSDVHCEPARQLLSDVLAVNVLQRVVDLLVDPDWINEVIIIALSDTPAETLRMIESFDESPVVEELRSPASKPLSKPVASAVSTQGKTTAGEAITAEVRPVQPVAADEQPPALLAERRGSVSSAGSSNANDSPDMSGRFEASTVVNKLEDSAVIGIVGHRQMRRSSMEMEYVAYSIQFKPGLLWPENCSLDLVQEVPRRYKQFDALYSRMKENPRLSQSLQGLEIPSKRILPLITQNQINDFAQARQERLDAFLKELCARPVLRQCEEFKSFLREGSLRGSSSGLLPRPLYRVFDVVGDIIRPRAPSAAVGLFPHWHKEEVGAIGAVDVFNAFTRSCSMAQEAASSADSVDAKEAAADRRATTEEWERRCAEWERRVKEAEQGTWRGQNTVECEDALRSAMSYMPPNASQPAAVPGSTPRDADFAVLDRRWPLTCAFFELGTSAIREPTSLKSDAFQKLIVCAVGRMVDDFVCTELNELLRERRLAYVVRLLRGILWPNGHWPEEAVEEKKSEKERAANKAEALNKLIDFLPGFLRIIVGPRTYDRGFAHVLESLQNPEINRCLAHGLLNVIIEHLATFVPPPGTPEYPVKPSPS